MVWDRMVRKTLSTGSILGAPSIQRMAGCLDGAYDAYSKEHIVGTDISAGGAHDDLLITRGWASWDQPNFGGIMDLNYGNVQSINQTGVGEYTVNLSTVMLEPYIAWAGARRVSSDLEDGNGIICVCNPVTPTTIEVKTGKVSALGNSVVATSASFFIEVKGNMEGNEVAYGSQYFKKTGINKLVAFDDIVSREDIVGIKESLISSQNVFVTRHDGVGEHYDPLITRGWIAAYFDPLITDYHYVAEGVITGATRFAEGIVRLSFPFGTFSNTSYLIAHTPMTGPLSIKSSVGNIEPYQGPWGGHFTVARNHSETRADIYIARPDGLGTYEANDSSFYVEVKGY